MKPFVYQSSIAKGKDLKMPDRPMTFPEKCQALARMNDLESRLSTLRYMALETELEIGRSRPGWSIDQMLGSSKDRPVNHEAA